MKQITDVISGDDTHRHFVQCINKASQQDRSSIQSLISGNMLAAFSDEGIYTTFVYWNI